MRKSSAILLSSLILLANLCLAVLSWCQEKIDLDTISRIRYKGFRNSKVTDIASGLIDAIGRG